MELIGRPQRDPREPPLRLGDVVQLHSGSPPLLVVDLLQDGCVVVAWRGGLGEICEHSFPAVCCKRLRLV